MKLHKIAAIILCVIISVSMTAPAAAVQQRPRMDVAVYNENVARLVAELEQKYNIIITYPTYSSGFAAIGPRTLETLDASLMFITPGVVREISEYFLNRDGLNGDRLTFAFEFLPNPDDTTILGSFNPDQATIRLFIPRTEGVMMRTGTNPKVIIHEMGHAFHEMAQSKYGAERLEREFTALNGNFTYRRGREQNPDPATFATAYASTSYQEDFAETFAIMFTSNRAGLGVAYRLTSESGQRTNLGAKVDLVSALIERYIDDSDDAIQNIQRVNSVPRQVAYSNMNWSGDALQFIGFSEPSGVYVAVRRYLDIDSEHSRWVREIGGWHIRDVSGDVFYVFPGGVYRRINGEGYRS